MSCLIFILFILKSVFGNHLQTLMLIVRHFLVVIILRISLPQFGINLYLANLEEHIFLLFFSCFKLVEPSLG